MKIHLKRCEFVVSSIVYLGHKILPNGIMAHWAKIIAILEMPNPIDVHTFRSFIGLCNYYKIYVQDFSSIAHPLYALLKKDVFSTWGIPSPSYIKSSGSHITMVQMLVMEGKSPHPMLTTRQHSGSSTT